MTAKLAFVGLLFSLLGAVALGQIDIPTDDCTWYGGDWGEEVFCGAGEVCQQHFIRVANVVIMIADCHWHLWQRRGQGLLGIFSHSEPVIPTKTPSTLKAHDF